MQKSALQLQARRFMSTDMRQRDLAARPLPNRRDRRKPLSFKRLWHAAQAGPAGGVTLPPVGFIEARDQKLEGVSK